ncbi:hypothetical protein CASFOL_005431 [Castilleja foliolosa]|uniref:Uncharacterized protein n=1 Tax=Castilleja foliolosa TaxID=1961234 RepID=A0ABD3E3E2_9LAMI
MLIYASTTMNPLPFSIIPKKIPTTAQYGPPNRSFGPSRMVCLPRSQFYMTGKSPPEIPMTPPVNEPAVPTEMPQGPNVPDFDPIPPENPADPPPLSPGPNPGPPDLVPPKPEAPGPPIPSPPGEPEIVPPYGPDVIPPRPPEPGPPFPTQPDIPPPIMGSDALIFY